jgi:heme exporter protein B
MIKKEIRLLLQKEWRTEWRRKTALYGLILYVFCTSFVLYLVVKQIHPVLWNALFWILMLFNALQVMSKSFVQEESGVNIFLYTQVSSLSVIMSKIIYNTVMMTVLSLLNYGFYTVIMGNPVQDTVIFLVNLILGSIAFAVVLTFIAALSSASAQQNSGLTAILGMPVFVPLLTVLIKVSKNAMDGLDRSLSYPHFLSLMAMIVAFLGTSLLLFPQIWKE